LCPVSRSRRNPRSHEADSPAHRLTCWSLNQDIGPLIRQRQVVQLSLGAQTHQIAGKGVGAFFCPRTFSSRQKTLILKELLGKIAVALIIDHALKNIKASLLNLDRYQISNAASLLLACIFRVGPKYFEVENRRLPSASQRIPGWKLKMNGINGHVGPSGLWQEARNADGRVYYYNTITKATQWNKPEELMTPAEVSINSPCSPE
jgi:hypothetical protein